MYIFDTDVASIDTLFAVKFFKYVYPPVVIFVSSPFIVVLNNPVLSAEVAVKLPFTTVFESLFALNDITLPLISVLPVKVEPSTETFVCLLPSPANKVITLLP